MAGRWRGRPRWSSAAGPIGVLATLYLTELGVNVVAADIDPNRAASATAFGAVQTMVVPTDGPFLGPEDEVSLVIEATGVPSSMVNAIHLVSHAGRIVQVGISQRDIPVPIKELTFKELDILGSRNSLALIPQGLELLARHEEAARSLITHRFDIADVNDAYHVDARPHRVRRQGRRPAPRCSLKGTEQMIRHVAVFKFKPTFTPEARQKWKDELTELPGQIDFLTSISVGDDQLHGARSFDAAVVADLDVGADRILDYINHPAHQAIGALSAPHIEQLVLVDFEV